MERISGLRSGMRAAAAGLFLVAALASMGCSNNALMNPQPSQGTQGGVTTANQGGHEVQPSGHEVQP